MSDQPVKRIFEVKCLTGANYFVETLYDMRTFFCMVKADGFLAIGAGEAVVPYHAIGEIKAVQPGALVTTQARGSA